MSDKPNVWLIQETWSNKADLTSARDYGTIRPILSSSDMPAIAPGPCAFKMDKALREYREGDSLVYALADPFSVFMAGVLFERQGLMRAESTWLRWERPRDADGLRKSGGFYVPSRFQF